MPKIDVNKVAEICKRNEVEPDKLRTIIEEMNLLVQPEVDEENPPALKKQYAFLLSDPDGVIPADYEFAGWVLQISENESTLSVNDRVYQSAYDFNASKKGRLMPANTVGEAIENIPVKIFKERGLWVKTKTPVLVLRTDNEIPREVTDKSASRGHME